MKREDVIRILREQQQELVEQYQITSLSLFGTITRREVSNGSKIGILVKFARPTLFTQFLDLKKRLEALLGCAVELGKPQALRPEFRTLVLQEAIRVI
jgi:predicted nucleotidyltransferase